MMCKGKVWLWQHKRTDDPDEVDIDDNFAKEPLDTMQVTLLFALHYWICRGLIIMAKHGL
jgi:hypothetical protein